MNEQYEMMQWHKGKERVKSQWIKRKQQDIFRGSSHCSTSPPSHIKIFNPLTCPHRTPTQGTSTEDLGQLQPGVHNSPLNRIQPLTEATQTPPHPRGVGTWQIQNNHLTLEGFQHKLHLSLEGAKPKIPPLTRGSQAPTSTSH